MKPALLIDFDSTMVSVESLDLLAEISLRRHPERESIVAQISQITRDGMEGKLDFRESLEQRLALLSATRADVEELVSQLHGLITPSFASHREQLSDAKDRIFVLTGGFREIVVPIAESLGLHADHVFANEFIYDENGVIIGFDQEIPLSRAGGKVEVALQLQIAGRVVAIGDGYTDFEIKERGAADEFFCFAEIIKRDVVAERADKVVHGIDEVFAELDLPTRYSFPRSKLRVLLLDEVDSSAADRLSAEGYRVEVINEKLEEADLIRELADVSILGIRTRSKLPAHVFNEAKRLQAVGVFAIGLDHVDLSHAASRGIAVFNAPYSNTRSVVEMALAQIIMLMRKIPLHNANMHNGQWVKFAKDSFEVRGKTLGIIGYGNIGSQLSVLAEAIGMDVIYYDLVEKLAHGKAKRVATMDELFAKSDVISLHCDGRMTNKNLIGAEEFAKMKPGVIFINLARGHVVDLPALREAVLSGHVSGAAVDVFPVEPKSAKAEFDSVLRGLDNVMITPHVGGSTEEAQRNIAAFVSERLLTFMSTGETYGSATLPEVDLAPLARGTRILHIHRNVPGLVARVSSILASHGVNIIDQRLKTRNELGYLVTDVSGRIDEAVLKEIRDVPETIRVREVYP